MSTARALGTVGVQNFVLQLRYLGLSAWWSIFLEFQSAHAHLGQAVSSSRHDKSCRGNARGRQRFPVLARDRKIVLSSLAESCVGIKRVSGRLDFWCGSQAGLGGVNYSLLNWACHTDGDSSIQPRNRSWPAQTGSLHFYSKLFWK